MKRRLWVGLACVAGLALSGAGWGQTSLTRSSAFEYDPASGLLIREIIEPNDPDLCLVTTYAYDAYGNKTGATTRNCNGTASGGVAEAAAPTGNAVFTSRTSTTTFAAGTQTTGGGLSWSAGQFPTTSTNALGHQETKEFDPRFGTVTKLTGPNGLTTTWTYDGFGRKASETRSDGTTTTWTYTLCGTCPTYGQYFVTETSTGAPTKTVYLDSLNREIRSETQGFDGTLVRKDTEYDSLGRVARVSQPYKVGATPVWTTYQYDVLGRVIQTNEPATGGGSVRTVTTYNGLTTTVTVSNAGTGSNMPEAVVQSRTTTKNSQGQVVQVTDTQGNNITYTYDPFGNLKTTNAGGVVTTLSYDLRGRKTQMVDPDMGTWQYAYNALGEFVWQKDAKNQVTAMAYDLLGRMTQRTEADLVSNWFYDAYQGGGSCPKGIGKLCQVTSDNNYARTVAYDSQGRISSVTTTIDTALTLSYTYDSVGRLDTTTYPTGFAVQNVYNALGYLWKVQRVNDPDTTVFWQANAMNAAGQVTEDLFGNGLTTTRTYDALSRMQAIQSSNAGGSVHHLNYTFDAIGNVTQRVDNVQAITENLAYDRLNRLLSSSGPGLATRSFNYDAVGNMTYKSDVGTYAYPALSGVRPHAVSSVSGGGVPNSVTASYTYDANGSLTSASGTIYPLVGSVSFSRTLSYTSFNMPATVAYVQGAWNYSYTYTYSAEHERVKLVTVRPTDTITSIYLHPAGKGGSLLYEKDTRASDGRVEHKHYVNGGAGLVGVYVTKSAYGAGDGPQMRYYHTDHLGSIAVITNPSGAVLERFSYEAFGERRYPNGTAQDRSSPLFGVGTDRGFTAHEHLDEMNLIHMNGRIYDPVLGRFMTADPFVQSPANLQGYNRYSYVMNNPLMYTDPSGYFLKMIAKGLKKAFKKVMSSTIGRIVVIAAAAWAGGWLASNWMISSATNSFLAGGGLQTSLVTLGGEAATLTTMGSAVAGAAGGFAAGFVGSGGDLEAGFQGALSGGLAGGVGAAFAGQGWSVQRVAAESVAGGISSELNGGRFKDGFLASFKYSGLTYIAYSMRLSTAKESGIDPRNSSGISDGWLGIAGKLGGGRFDPDVFNRLSADLFGEFTMKDYLAMPGSPLGGHQGGPGRFFMWSYGPGDFLDRVVEAYSGVHDKLNSWFWYGPDGNIRRGMGHLERAFGEVLNAANVAVATPIVGASAIPPSAYGVLAVQKNR
jgi:RHS repeat-associated protein